MITAAHLILNSTDADADRAFLRDVLGWTSVHASGPDDQWLIFRVPPAELGVHPTDGPPSTHLYLMCDDIHATMAELRAKGAEFSGDVDDHGYGLVAMLQVPGADDIQLYQPRHVVAYDL